jgi:hypothetical protein
MAQDRIYLECLGCGTPFMLAAVRANQELDVPPIDGYYIREWLEKHLTECHPVAKEEVHEYVGWFSFEGNPGFKMRTESSPPTEEK